VLNPARYDITIHQGATFELPVQYKDSTGAPVDMTNYTVSGTLYDTTGTDKLSDFSLPWTAQASGMFKLRLEAATTSGITEQGQYDILVTKPDGDKFYLLQGTAFIDLGLTGR
jgi:hypothetical protein